MRIETIGNATLYFGDAREIIPPRLPDAVVTDIPYERSQLSNGLRLLDYGEWDGDGSGAMALRILRGLAGVPTVVAFCHWDQMNDIQRMFPDRMWRPIIWAKNNPTVINGEYLFLPFGEWAYYGKLAGAWFGGRCVPAMWCGKGPVQREHPTQKPLRLMEWIVVNVVAPGAMCFDPFMGSGTTGVACVRLGRKFVGVEKDPTYFDVACRRIERAQLQGDMLNTNSFLRDQHDGHQQRGSA